LRALSFSYCFPHRHAPTWGIFVYQRLVALSGLLDLEVCSPAPWFPFFSLVRPGPGPVKEIWEGLIVHRPRFFLVPGVLKDFDARLYAWGMANWLEKRVCTQRPDVLDAHFVWPDGVGVSLLARKVGLPYTITLRGKLYECAKFPKQLKQCAEALSGAAAVIAVSTGLAEEAARLGADKRGVYYIPNGVDKRLFHPRNTRECRRKVGLPEEERLLVTIAHLGHRKGHHEVIRALGGLPADVCLVLVGGSAQGGTPRSILAVAREAGVENRIILVGPQPHERIPLYLCAADVAVLASYREGCPNMVLESLACGTPVVATRVGAVPDILPVPDCGRIVPPREVSPLRQALLEVLESDWAQEEVERKSGVKSWDEVAQEVKDVFRKVVK